MTGRLPTPPVPDLARIEGGTVKEAVDWLITFFNSGSAPFNYRRGTLATRRAYQGLHQLPLLTAGCRAEKTDIGRKSNVEVVESAAPYAFGRQTQVFDLPPRRFHFGRDRSSAYRVPFFFVENGIIKIYFLQPRKGFRPNVDQLGFIAGIMKKYLLDTEFYGDSSDIEFVDVSVPYGQKDRHARKFSLAALELWSERRLEDRLTLISEALDAVSASDQVVRRHRQSRTIDPSMPLFD